MSKKTKFNKLWLDPELHPQFDKWLSDVPDNVYQAYCTVCSKPIELSNMGKRALDSHCSKSNTHKSNFAAKFQQKAVSQFFRQEDKTCNQTSSVELSQASSSSGTSHAAASSTLNSYLLKDDVLKAECLWAMHVVTKRMSYNSCANIGEMFSFMFPDSNIAKQFSLGSSKVAYLVSYGLAPYFINKLMDRIKVCTDFVICFDEAFNKVIHKGQMDLVIRFWDENLQVVSTRYLCSVFLSRATADDLHEKFIEGLSGLPLPGLLQVSMDGCNHCFLRKLTSTLENDVSNSAEKKILDLGTCGLHVVHGCFKHGLKTVNWDLNNLLTHMYFVFKDSPSRRAQYTDLTGSKLFPLKFCSTRWVENVQCLGRAIDIFEDIKKFVQENTNLSSKPATSIVKAANDPMTKCKLSFFKTIASECEPFLKRFLCSKPLAPFLYEALHDLIRKLMTRFVKDDKMKAAVSARQLVDIDLSQVANLIHFQNVDIGFASRKYLVETKASDKDVVQFKMQCRKFLVAIVDKLKERSPLKCSMVRGVSAFDPYVIKYKPKNGTQRIQAAIECLHLANRIDDDVAEKAKQQYADLTKEANASFKDHFENFCRAGCDEIGLDKFFFDILASDKNFLELWKVVKMCLILSHGNASVESGFSINKSLLIENLHEPTLINQRHVYDAILEAGGIHAIDMNKKFLSYARSSHKRYKDDVEKKRKIEEKEENEKKAVKEQEKKIKELEEMKRRIRKAAEMEQEAIENELKFLKKKQRKI